MEQKIEYEVLRFSDETYDVEYVIVRKEKMVSATVITGHGTVVYTGCAICHPSDEFDLKKGMKLAVRRSCRVPRVVYGSKARVRILPKSLYSVFRHLLCE